MKLPSLGVSTQNNEVKKPHISDAYVRYEDNTTSLLQITGKSGPYYKYPKNLKLVFQIFFETNP